MKPTLPFRGLYSPLEDYHTISFAKSVVVTSWLLIIKTHFNFNFIGSVVRASSSSVSLRLGTLLDVEGVWSSV